jgi:hypothetical protein
MAASTYRASITNVVQGIFNPAIVDFTFLTSTPTDAEKVAGVAAYFVSLGTAGFIAPNCVFQGVTKVPAGGGAGTPMMFPVAEYANLQAANPGVLTFQTAFPFNLAGSGGYEPLGTSLTMSLYSAIPGRKSTGRHYVPWISTDLNTGNGVISPASAAQCQNLYRTFLLGESPPGYSGVLDLVPVVHSATFGDHVIVQPKCSVNYSRLKTRTR